MRAYSRKAHGAYFGHLMRTVYFRALLAVYAFLTFFGVMPKTPARSPFQGSFEYLALTIGSSLVGFAALGVVVALACAIWSGTAAARGLVPPAHPIPDQAADGGPL
jgi:hypothetical protein